jgi:dTDP-4-dehydrorhamnose reductase
LNLNGSRVLVTGANGMLGNRVANILKQFGANVTLTSRNKGAPREYVYAGNLLNDEFLDQIISKRFDIILHTAAFVNLKYCEANSLAADRLHGYIVPKLVDACEKFIYISTDSVFDGVSGNYKPHDSPQPLNAYAHSKVIGEQCSLQNDRSLVVRSNIYGFNSSLRTSLFEWSINNMLQQKPIIGYDNIIFNPLYVNQLSRYLVFLIQNDYCGIVNAASERFISKYDFLFSVRKIFQLNSTILKRQSAVDGEVFRPKNTTLNTGSMDIKYSLQDGIIELRNDYEKFYSN